MTATATGKRWLQRAPAAATCDLGGVPPAIARLLAARGLSAAPAAEAFLRGALEREHDPLLLPNIEPALARIEHAMRDGEQIAVFGDFDVDGVTATAILVEGIASLGGNIIPYLPDRFSEGYGVNSAALSELRRRGVSLVLTADCGINADREVDHANEIGLDVIVVDHHSIPGRLPDAVALVDPKFSDSVYPCAELSAGGIAFKLLGALAERLGRPFAPERYLDLVALSTVCDMAPLVGENRALVRQGLKALQRTSRPGIVALAEAAGADLAKATAWTLGFQLGPRLNAAGRVAHANLAYELLSTHDEARARELAAKLHAHNVERQKQTLQAVEVSRTLIEHEDPEAPLLMVGHAKIQQGIVGLVASRLADTYHRPAVVYQQLGECCRGSARSIPAFNIVEALYAAAPLMTRFGGHRQAGGFTAPSENVPALREALVEQAHAQLDGQDLTPTLEYDDEIDLGGFGKRELQWFPFLEPFGLGNPEPQFLARGLEVLDRRAVGADRTHLQLRLRSNGVVWRGIAFGLAEAAPRPGDRLDALFSIRPGRSGAPELHVKDFAAAS
ncbi:MAG TPA: single-stranded-DNA-specific exonuclease RecJ [Dehalococcoidia bacterium]|nr:single-stranded-DNA-specific exonuclease RecJ [Dehalococcoidia bacterium]